MNAAKLDEWARRLSELEQQTAHELASFGAALGHSFAVAESAALADELREAWLVALDAEARAAQLPAHAASVLCPPCRVRWDLACEAIAAKPTGSAAR